MKKKNRSIILFSVAILFCLNVTQTSMADELRSPWEVSNEKYLVKVKTPATRVKRNEKDYETNPAKIPFLWGLKFYQKVISPIDGDKCGMYPTCSGYGYRAVKKHGAAIGLMMTADRLIHEGTELDRAPLIKKYGVIRYYDPLHNNDFWFAKEDDPA